VHKSLFSLAHGFIPSPLTSFLSSSESRPCLVKRERYYYLHSEVKERLRS
jgi:hypothetical protein